MSTVLQCGVKPRENYKEFIVGGMKSSPREFPWLAAIYITNGSGIWFVCGGSLVSNNVVVTGKCAFLYLLYLYN
jgi:hypothetical protein